MYYAFFINAPDSNSWIKTSATTDRILNGFGTLHMVLIVENRLKNTVIGNLTAGADIQPTLDLQLNNLSSISTKKTMLCNLTVNCASDQRFILKYCFLNTFIHSHTFELRQHDMNHTTIL